ncbi:hypothetical protein ACU4GD_29545 [Cupriavidus basilensis]
MTASSKQQPTLYLTELDVTRLERIAGRAGAAPLAEMLDSILERAAIVAADAIPKDVVTMNSSMLCVLEGERRRRCAGPWRIRIPRISTRAGCRCCRRSGRYPAGRAPARPATACRTDASKALRWSSCRSSPRPAAVHRLRPQQAHSGRVLTCAFRTPGAASSRAAGSVAAHRPTGARAHRCPAPDGLQPGLAGYRTARRRLRRFPRPGCAIGGQSAPFVRTSSVSRLATHHSSQWYFSLRAQPLIFGPCS